ncbi:MAG TPA: class III signal peptide-containing protein [Chloroflexota bacterium]|nr:class III signal peptide-containing protein [Chloroflexota bacterium]HZU06272.1 class III signal peptide-containing protein [Chloroflexota bacterium]
MEGLTALFTRLRGWLSGRERGQGTAEYSLIIAAIAIAVLVAIFALAPKLAATFGAPPR